MDICITIFSIFAVVAVVAIIAIVAMVGVAIYLREKVAFKSNAKVDVRNGNLEAEVSLADDEPNSDKKKKE